MRTNRQKIVSIGCDGSNQDYVELFVDEFKDQEPLILLDTYMGNPEEHSPIVLSPEGSQQLIDALKVSIQKLAEAKLTRLIAGDKS